MMLEDAREALARDPAPGVVYTPPGGGSTEEGTITSVNDRFVFVRYGRSRTSAATEPHCLTLLAADVAAKLAVNPQYQSALRDAESESWDGPGVGGGAMIDAVTERRRQWRAGLRHDAGPVVGDG